jgi:hypothetical protein
LIIVIGAPRTIGRSGFLKADDGRKHTKDEPENPHGNLSPAQEEAEWFSNSDSDPGILFPHSRRAGAAAVG